MIRDPINQFNKVNILSISIGQKNFELDLKKLNNFIIKLDPRLQILNYYSSVLNILPVFQFSSVQFSSVQIIKLQPSLVIYLMLIFNQYSHTKKKIMPQLVPFYFVNEITFTFVIIALIVYILSKYILPRFVRLFLSRTFISKLLNNSINKQVNCTPLELFYKQTD